MNIETSLKAGGLENCQAKDQFSGGQIFVSEIPVVGVGTQHNLNTETRYLKEPKKNQSCLRTHKGCRIFSEI